MKNSNVITDYEQACIALTKAFIERYFVDDETTLDDIDYFFVGDEIGDVCAIADYFWNMNDMNRALKNEVSSDDLFAWYWESIDSEAEVRLSLVAWLNNKKPALGGFGWSSFYE